MLLLAMLLRLGLPLQAAHLTRPPPRPLLGLRRLCSDMPCPRREQPAAHASTRPRPLPTRPPTPRLQFVHSSSGPYTLDLKWRPAHSETFQTLPLRPIYPHQ